MGTQNGNQCFCSRKQDLDYGRHYDGVCDMSCAGDEVRNDSELDIHDKLFVYVRNTVIHTSKWILIEAATSNGAEETIPRFYAPPKMFTLNHAFLRLQHPTLLCRNLIAHSLL